MSELKVVFVTPSDIEASVVRGLLDSHDIEAWVSSDAPHAIFPMGLDQLREIRISVFAEEAATARQLIDDFHEVVSARVGRLRDEFASLESALGYRFRDRGLLEHALTHRSRAHEDASGGVVDNESLEFLGDAVLGLVVADRLFREFPDYDEGQKSKARAQMVSAASLARLGERLQLGSHLLLGRGEEKTGGRRKPSLIADTFEAVIAAIYLDGGFAAADAFIDRQFRSALDEVHEHGVVAGLVADHKSALQEWVHANGLPLPTYRLAGTRGPDHLKVFDVEVVIDGQAVASAEGRSKKDAEQRAAQAGLRRLREAPADTTDS
jgi:ribonuclease-3